MTTEQGNTEVLTRARLNTVSCTVLHLVAEPCWQVKTTRREDQARQTCWPGLTCRSHLSQYALLIYPLMF